MILGKELSIGNNQIKIHQFKSRFHKDQFMNLKFLLMKWSIVSVYTTWNIPEIPTKKWHLWTFWSRYKLCAPVASAFGIYFNWKLEPPLWIYHAFFGMTSPGQCHETLILAQWMQATRRLGTCCWLLLATESSISDMRLLIQPTVTPKRTP